MKKLFIISAIAFSGLLYNTADAQIRVHLGFRFGPRPIVYAPARVVVEQTPVYQQQEPAYDNTNYDNNDDYYYLPDVDAYYNVNDNCYVYFDGDNWISAAYLPGQYRDYDWRNARRYEVRAARPYMHADFYRQKYDGHQFNGWANNNGGGRGEDRGFDRGHGEFNRPEQFGRDDRRFDRGREGYGQPNRGDDHRFDNRGQGGYNQSTQPNGGNGGQYNNHGNQGGYGQPAQPNGGNGGQYNSHGNQGGYGQPTQPNNGGNGGQYNNHGQQNGHGQSAQPNGGNGQPANQGGGHDRGNGGGADQHFADNNPRGGLTAHRMARF